MELERTDRPRVEFDHSTTPVTLKCYVSWEQIDQAIDYLGSILKGQKWDGILGIARGGLIPATMLAHKLEMNNMQIISVEGYDHMSKKDHLTIKKIPTEPGDGKNWVIVDDIADTGRTLVALRKIYPKATYVALYVKPTGKHLVDHCGQTVTDDCWISFPWERDE